MGIYFRLGAPVGLAVLLFLLLLQAAGRGEVGLALLCVAGIGMNVATVLLVLRTERRREQRRRIAEEEMLAEIAQWKMCPAADSPPKPTPRPLDRLVEQPDLREPTPGDPGWLASIDD